MSTTPVVNLFDQFETKKAPVAQPVETTTANLATPPDLFKQFGAPTPPPPQTAEPTPILDVNKQQEQFHPFDMFKAYDVNNSVSLSTEERHQSSRPDPENQIDEPWYSKTWDWLNKPLYDAHQWGVRTGAGGIERGLESGAEDLISGFSSPLSLALTAVTFGGSALAKAGLTGAAKAFAELTPSALLAIVVPASNPPFLPNSIHTLLSAGFT